MRAVPFNITIVQAYAPISDNDDNEIGKFYDQLIIRLCANVEEMVIVPGDNERNGLITLLCTIFSCFLKTFF